MKKKGGLLLIIVFISVIMFVIITKADQKIMSNDEALRIGEEKYLEFLWMVDGAFNSDRLKEDFIVNGKSLPKENKVFTCKYRKSKSVECIGNNFESEFRKLFSENVKYENVYSDGSIYSWIYYKDGKYIFNNLNNCSINRMGINQHLRIVEIMDDKMIFEASFLNRENNQMNNRNFVLVLEDRKWKISSAFYYDLCGMWYTIY